jgi:hypothetical protein
MSETFTTIISNVKDEEGDDALLKIVFKKNLYQEPGVSAEAFDSKGRYFYAKSLERDLEGYINHAEKGTLEVIYCDYEGTICIEIQGGRWGQYETLQEDKYSPYHLQSINNHLQSINNEIAEAEEKLKILIKKKLQIEKFYGNLNLL